MEIGEIVSKIAKERTAFRLKAVDLALFPDLGHPRAAAIRLDEISGELLALEAAIRKGTSGFGQPPENRDHVPHVTFGRIKNPDRREQRLMADLWREKGLPKLPIWPVNDFKLFMSELRPGGSVYTPLATFPLG